MWSVSRLTLLGGPRGGSQVLLLLPRSLMRVTALSNTSHSNEGNNKEKQQQLFKAGSKVISLKELKAQKQTGAQTGSPIIPNNEETKASSPNSVTSSSSTTGGVTSSMTGGVTSSAVGVTSSSSSRNLDRNFMTTLRAMHDFALTSDQLANLRVTRRRNPTGLGPPINVYWRKDVEAKAVEVWGSRDRVDAERRRRDTHRDHENSSRSILSRLRHRLGGDSRLTRAKWPVRNLRLGDEMANHESSSGESGLRSRSGRVVLVAIGVNSLNFVGKLIAWLMTGSHALFSETVHSLADTVNQVILAYGLHSSLRKPTESHPYGYHNMQYVSSLISGVGIFCMGAGLSVYHGINGIVNPDQHLEPAPIAFIVLLASLVSEGITLALAIKAIRQSAESNAMTFTQYVSGGYDPCVNVVLLEDAAAVTGVGIASIALASSLFTNSHLPDAIGSVVIGAMLGGVASFMIYTNTAALVGRSIPEEKLELINRELEGDIMIRQVHDVKGIDMGNGIVRYKAEVDVDGRELAKFYLHKHDLKGLLKELKAIQNDDEELERFLLKHGENIVDCLGEQVDRIERELRRMHPEVRYIDLEVL